ncbi:hypothetical protein MNBD_GAMMA12-3355 [hydrothermal vent metagenome]|uniref:Uncharacterized protein n=1 Tax=hydrothermal vent metagenome TaxID=652676 RepID=A0A3B0YAT1_9ZZZZ
MDSDNQETVLVRRLYFLFPDTIYTQQAVDELKLMGVDERDMHTVANRKVDIGGLPLVKAMGKQDKGNFIEELFWIVNINVFFAALVLFLSDLLSGISLLTLIPLVVIIVCAYFGSQMSDVPKVTLEDFSFAIKRGEVLLMVDLAVDVIAEISDRIQLSHPEAIIGGIGVSIE